MRVETRERREYWKKMFRRIVNRFPKLMCSVEEKKKAIVIGFSN